MAGRARPLALLAMGFLVLLLSAGAALYLSQRQTAVFADARQTMENEKRLDAIQTLIIDAETGQRGFLLTGRIDYLNPFVLARQQLGPAIDDYARRVTDPVQLSDVASLRQLTSVKISELQKTVDLRQAGRLTDALELVNNDAGAKLMSDIRGVLADMRIRGRDALEQRDREVEQAGRAALLILAASILLVIGLAIFTVRDSQRRIAKLEAANEQIRKEMEVRRAAESQVRHLQKLEAVGQLTGGIAHDFNNMLAVVMSSLDLARRKLEAGDVTPLSRYLESAMEGSKRAATLTSRLLAFARRQPLEPKVLDANTLIGSISELIRRTIGETIEVESVLAGGLWPIFADPAQIENALVNLAVNARDAMPNGGKLTIETANAELDESYARDNEDAVAGQYVVISVTDTGTGMPPEVIERAFDPFYTTKGPGKGTGLGLSQVFGFVKQSGGHVKIYSEPGRGTTVKLYLPRNRGAGAVAGERRHESGIPSAKRAETVLVVEDDAAVARAAVDSLEALGYTVIPALSPADALGFVARERDIALLFTDVVMPETNGRELAEQARVIRPDIKVLYTTGYAPNAMVHNGVLNVGANFLAKPYTLEQLARKVREALDA